MPIVVINKVSNNNTEFNDKVWRRKLSVTKRESKKDEGIRTSKVKEKILINISYANRFIWSDCLINLLQPMSKEIKKPNCLCFNENTFLVSILFHKEKLDSDGYLTLNTNGLDEIY